MTLLVRPAVPDDDEAVRAVLAAAYAEFEAIIPPEIFGLYLADILDVAHRAEYGDQLVAEHDGRVAGTVSYYPPDAGDPGYGIPAGWAGVRALGVDPAARGLGAGRALMDACLERAVAAGAKALSLHTAAFMRSAVAIYERMGFVRNPELDFDPAALFDLRDEFAGRERPHVIAYRLDL
jgi:GNAT superfamily N-acetyltransferase